MSQEKKKKEDVTLPKTMPQAAGKNEAPWQTYEISSFYLDITSKFEELM